MDQNLQNVTDFIQQDKILQPFFKTKKRTRDGAGAFHYQRYSEGTRWENGD